MDYKPRYDVEHTASGWGVYRPDGAYAEFLDSAEAEAAAQRLNSGDEAEEDYLWAEAD